MMMSGLQQGQIGPMGPMQQQNMGPMGPGQRYGPNPQMRRHATRVDAHGQVIIETDENLSDKEIYPGQSISQMGEWSSGVCYVLF